MGNELKTLKELRCVCNRYDCKKHHQVDYNGLRVEAIKWIKGMETDSKFGVEYNHQFAPNEYLAHKVSITEWIKHFFNITKEELK